MVGCAEKPAKSPGAENPPKKPCRKFATKKTPNRKEAQDGRSGVHETWIQMGLVLFSIEKSGLPHDR
jgi:hypothetical protein